MEEENKYSISALVGRFQVHELHKAHRYVIDQVVKNSKKVILFLGVPKVVGTKKNPLDFETRKKMIQLEYPDIVISPLPDFSDDKTWTKELDRRIREIYPIGEVLLYGGRDSFIPFYKKSRGQFDCKELEQHTYVSGTEVRKLISEEVKNSPDFRAGVIYNSYNQYPKVHPCVDVAILNERDEVLMSKTFEDKWKFIGTFSHPKDTSFEDSAIRKIKKDIGGSIEIENLEYLGSSLIQDWRYKSEEDKIITNFYSTKIKSGSIEPSDNISELRWVPFVELDSWLSFDNKYYIGSNIAEEHVVLLKILLKKIGK